MEELTLTTPALLFSAVFADFAGLYQSFFIVCAAGATVAGPLYGKSYGYHGSTNRDLRKRLNLTRTMQGLGIASLFFCVVSMFLIYIGLQLLSVYVFGLALILLIASLGVSFREIQISTRSLEIYLGAMEKGKIKK